MYKLCLTSVRKRISSHGVLFMPKQIIMQSSIRLCSYCNFYHGKVSKIMHHQIRNNATTVKLSSDSTIKKKVKQRSKKYSELMEVSDKATQNKRTTGKNLRVSNIFKLVDQPDNEMDELHEINDTCPKHINKDDYAFYNNNIDYNIEDTTLPNNIINCEDLYDDIEESDKFKKGPLNKKGNKTVDTSKMKKDSQDIQKNSATVINERIVELYIESLLAHMQVYLSCGMLSRATKTLMKYRKYKQRKFKCDQQIELYNILLEAYASEGDLEKVIELYHMIKKDSLKPTPQTYVYLFDALGRNNIDLKQKALMIRVQCDMNDNNISFNDIFTKSHFNCGQQNTVLNAIRHLNPKFNPSYTTLNTEYMYNLLSNVFKRNDYESPVKGLVTIDELKNYLNKQLENESALEVQIKSIEKPSLETVVSKHKEKLIEIENYWREIVSTAFKRNLKSLKEKECRSKSLTVLWPFFEVLNEEDYVNAILREIKHIAHGSETYSTSLKLLHVDLGKFIFRKYEIKMKKQTGVIDKIVSVYQKYLEWYLDPTSVPQLKNMNNRTIWQHFECEQKEFGTSLDTICINWPSDVIAAIGKFLYNIILNDIIIQPEMFRGPEVKCSIPAFYTLFRNRGNYLAEQIKPHPLVSKLYRDSQIDMLTFSSILLPSYCPSRPWTSIYTGGYPLTRIEIVRAAGFSDNPWKKLVNTPLEQLYPVLDSLNQLSGSPWIINCAILDIVIEIFQRGGSVELNVPQSISVLCPPASINKTATSEEKRSAAISMAKYKQRKYEMYSLWCDSLYRLSIANHFRDKIFWLPHNLDFRGRVYPIPPHLNHLSSDLGRSLLLFAKAKPLGPNGLDWLKVHVINLTSLKKSASIKERLAYADENIENILDSAAKPLTGKMWWAKSEEPWQTLAGCMEIANALKAPDIEKYESRFPVHQDGSCNGLQHYAALGRDQIGAESVNLHPFDTPKDVYSTVVSMVEKRRQEDAENGSAIAKVLKNFVKRKVIKQTVMTTVYGVTKYGAKSQIAKQLRDLEDFPEEFIMPASMYLTEQTFTTLRTMFESAREIQDWFTMCARVISSVCRENVEWTTPLGLPIVQPYIKQQKYIKKPLKGKDIPDTLKQKNAFAPNFIHSLDSTHMMLTSLHCRQANIDFVSVHDCFWTHACTVDGMNKICREQFVALHTEPILENLAASFVQRYEPIYMTLQNRYKSIEEIREYLTKIPKKGTFDIKHVLSSTYFFS
ncbi:DNA-directed RNA polymerase, mitochondrial [Hylaeus volcanicus]|uniref:DNA-directed RNA polymerase, mitochondrial n=1 Tax=Hylaeus volcanicus TaxID=313075 RepID=UPI0023B7CAC1|nr:DNA-directed RNA polymerase, mitochondrial [Hylaeus volcanicus]